MRKIVDVLRLKFETGLSHERIAAATKVSKGAVTKYVQRARDAGLGWPLPPEVDEARKRPGNTVWTGRKRPEMIAGRMRLERVHDFDHGHNNSTDHFGR
jgi:hypothetical protein